MVGDLLLARLEPLLPRLEVPTEVAVAFDSSELGVAAVELGLAGDELRLAGLDLCDPRVHLLELLARRRELLLELLRLCANSGVSLLDLGLAATERRVFGGDACGLFRDALLAVAQSRLATGEILLAPLELVLARAPLALAHGELLLRLGQLVLARHDDGVPLRELGGAALEESFVLGELGGSCQQVFLQLRGPRLRAGELVLQR